jgi:hypothetical protein
VWRKVKSTVCSIFTLQLPKGVQRRHRAMEHSESSDIQKMSRRKPSSSHVLLQEDAQDYYAVSNATLASNAIKNNPSQNGLVEDCSESGLEMGTRMAANESESYGNGDQDIDLLLESGITNESHDSSQSMIANFVRYSILGFPGYDLVLFLFF